MYNHNDNVILYFFSNTPSPWLSGNWVGTPVKQKTQKSEYKEFFVIFTRNIYILFQQGIIGQL